MNEIILSMKGITKLFPGVKALDNVNFDVLRGEIHALVGENGAGKSTLMNVLSGVFPHGSYSGEFFFLGEECKFHSVNDSEKRGIVFIHQELALIPQLSIAENIFLGNERGRSFRINWSETFTKASALLKMVGLDVDPHTLIQDLGVGQQQLVEIAKAISKDVRLLILDEPTAALNENDSQKLLKLLLSLQQQGITSILISHKLNEVEQVANSITVLRDGSTIETLEKEKDKISESRIIRGMVGRSMEERFPARDCNIGNTVFEVKNWNVHHPLDADRKIVNDVSIQVKQGEIVGISGLMGSGRTEFAMSLFGKSYGQNITGDIFIHGKKAELNSVKDAIAHGLAYVTEDRKSQGLILESTIRSNITLANLRSISHYSVIDQDKEVMVADNYKELVNIRTPSIEQHVRLLSGGNQQKVLLSKWLFANPDILILDEPTRGIDVGAKYEIYTIINSMVSEGKSVLFISSEMPEILGMCDRIYVMNKGRIVAEYDAADATQESIMESIVKSDRGELTNAKD